jgi:hypothetical protein
VRCFPRDLPRNGAGRSEHGRRRKSTSGGPASRKTGRRNARIRWQVSRLPTVPAGWGHIDPSGEQSRRSERHASNSRKRTCRVMNPIAKKRGQ